MPKILSDTILAIALFIVVWGIAACTALRPQPLSAPVKLEELDNAIPTLMRQRGVPGMAVAVVDGGEVAWAKGYGWADVRSRVRVTQHTVFQAASLSKPVSAWVAMKLVEEGRLDLDVPVSQYLNPWHLPASEFDNDEVTLRRILSHTAGLSIGGYLGILPGAPLQTLEDSLASAVDADRQPLAVVFQPGSGWHYSGGGYTLMQLLIERVTGKPFAAVAQDMLASLGMNHSTFLLPNGTAKTATGYDRRGNPVPAYRFTALAAAGLWSTAADLGRMLAALMAGPANSLPGRDVLGPATIGQMLSPQPGSSNDLLFSRSEWGLGYGLKRLSRSDEMLVFHPGDNIPAWHGIIAAVPAKALGLVVLTNGENGRELRLDTFCFWYRMQRLEALPECEARR